MSTIAERNNAAHTKSELGNLWVSQRLIRDWANDNGAASYEVIPRLYTALHRGVVNTHDGDQELFLHHFLRKGDVRLTGNPSDLLPEGRFVYLLMAKYCDELDQILREKPKTTQKAIEDASLAFYVFERIHPFPDGNGRIGRMITKTVLRSAGLRDPMWHGRDWYKDKRSEQLTALERVGQTNNLAHLELYLTRTLNDAYEKEGIDHRMLGELGRISMIKQKEASLDTSHRRLSDVWDGFADVPVYGNK